MTCERALRTVGLMEAELQPVDGAGAVPGSVTLHRLLYEMSVVPLAGLWLGLLVAAWCATLTLAVTPLLPAMLTGSAAAVRTAIGIEGYLARHLLDARVGPSRPGRPRRGYWAAVPGVLGDGRFWRAQAFLSLRVALGSVTVSAILTVLGAGLLGVAAPVVYRFMPSDGPVNGIDLGFWMVDTLREALLLVPVGLVLLVAGLGMVHLSGRMWRGLAVGVLGGDGAAVTGTPLAPTLDPVPPERLRRGAAATGLVAGGVVAVLVVIWALTTRGYFWPVWAALPLALVAGVVAWVAWVLGDPAARTRVSVGVTITGGIYACVVAFLVGVWALTTRWYFWPVWPALGLAVVLAVHLTVVRLAVPGPRLQERIERLTSTRSAAIDAQEAELRRIERDLHDGAQARLVSLGMTIGMAEQKLDSDPGSARRLLEEARGGAHEALDELRDLARGIRPPVLQDRGLVAAVRELAVRSPFEVDVVADLAGLPPAVESAAYFVVAESLANAGKHAGAGRIGIRLVRAGDVLVVEVSDDGRGGADPDGGGLTGLRHRVEALDGTLRVASPPSGPTVVHAQLPCGSAGPKV